MATQSLIWYGFGRDFFRFSPKNTSIDFDDDFVFLSLIGNMSEKNEGYKKDKINKG